MTAPYPNGSNSDRLSGIWQDVSLLALPAVRAADVFVKPWLDRDMLEAEVTVRNDTEHPCSVELGAEVLPWLNEAGGSTLEARSEVAVGRACDGAVGRHSHGRGRGTASVTLAAIPGGRLKTWSPSAPNLYALLVRVRVDGRDADTRYQRFGWRQFAKAAAISC
jgi:beta-galactosidase